MEKIRQTRILQRNPKDEAYTDRMVADLKAQPRQPIPRSTEQSESTKRLLAMSEDELIAHRARPMVTVEQAMHVPVGALIADPEFGKKYLGEREISAQEHCLEENRRRSAKNETGDAVSQPDFISPWGMHKDAAVDAFMNTEPAPYTPMERYRIKNNHLDGEPEPKEQPKRSVFGKLGDLFPKLSLGDNKTQADLPPPQSMADKYGRE